VIQEKKTDENGARVYRSERSLGSFYRAIPLPTRVDAQNSKATYENGVLTIRLPKLLKEEEKGVQILVT
jgi:HSP20 family protein